MMMRVISNKKIKCWFNLWWPLIQNDNMMVRYNYIVQQFLFVCFFCPFCKYYLNVKMKQNIYGVYITKNLEQQSAFTQQMNRIQAIFYDVL